jgi:hypothetical protein
VSPWIGKHLWPAHQTDAYDAVKPSRYVGTRRPPDPAQAAFKFATDRTELLPAQTGLGMLKRPLVF